MHPARIAIESLPADQREAALSELDPRILAELSRELPPSLNEFARDYCNLRDLSPLLRSIFHAVEGRKFTDIDTKTCLEHFGCWYTHLPRKRFRTVAIRAGGRAGKTSRIVAPAALHAAWTVPAPLLAPGESPYVAIVAPSLKLARQALSFVKGYASVSPVLSASVVSNTAEHVALRRPDGKVAIIEVFAATRGGAQLRAKTLLGAFFDESAFFRDEATGVVCDKELYRAVSPRIVPGGRCWFVSTPWVANVGLLEEKIEKNWGNHRTCLAITAPTLALFPGWDPLGTIRRELQEDDPDNYSREILAIPLASGSHEFFSRHAIQQSIHEELPQKLPRRVEARYFAGADMGFRKNSSTLVIVEKLGDQYRVACVEEMRPQPGMPLSPAKVVDWFAPVIREYGCDGFVTDSHERDAVALEMARHKLSAYSDPGKEEAHVSARKLFHEGRVQMPKNPRLSSQLLNIVAKPMPGGGISLTSPRSADGSHGDLASALILGLWSASKWQKPLHAISVGTKRGTGW